MPDTHDYIIDDIVEESIDKIRERLQNLAASINQRIYWFVKSQGPPDIKIESLEKISDQYRLKALMETDKRKEMLYKIMSDTCKLKSDYIRLTETDQELQHRESQNIIRNIVEDNESIHDLSRLDRFKEWVKKNGLALEGITTGIASIITTISISARNAIKKEAKATGKFAKAVFSLGKKLSPILIPLFNMLATVLSWRGKGLSWLASNLWVLVLAKK